MEACKLRQDVLPNFNEDVSSALNKACEYDPDDDAINLARAAKIVRRDTFKMKNLFKGANVRKNLCQFPF